MVSPYLRLKANIDQKVFPISFYQYIRDIFVSSVALSAAKMDHRYPDERHPQVSNKISHDDVIKWKHFPRYWPFVRGIPRLSVNSPIKGQRRAALMFSLICVGINGWVNNRGAGNLRRHRAHYDVIVMKCVDEAWYMWSRRCIGRVFH